MSALFNFHSFLTVVLLVICTCTYIKMQFPAILERKTGFRGFFWKAARIGLRHRRNLLKFVYSSDNHLNFNSGERLSPWVAFGCFAIGPVVAVEVFAGSCFLVLPWCFGINSATLSISCFSGVHQQL
ncbi:hypothetical protein MUK42_14065, partial [Musa troglodytarum]